MIDDQAVSRLQSVMERCVGAAARVLPVDVVEDAAQEAWARLLQTSVRGRALSIEERVAYLVGIFHKVCADSVRRYSRRRRLLAFESEVGEAPLEVADRSNGEKGMDDLIANVVRPVLSGWDPADVDLWVEAKIEGRGWKVAGEAAGMNKAEIARARQRISRLLSAGDAIRRFMDVLGVEPRTPNPEPRTPNPEPRTPNPEPIGRERQLVCRFYQDWLSQLFWSVRSAQVPCDR